MTNRRQQRWNGGGGLTPRARLGHKSGGPATLRGIPTMGSESYFDGFAQEVCIINHSGLKGDRFVPLDFF